MSRVLPWLTVNKSRDMQSLRECVSAAWPSAVRMLLMRCDLSGWSTHCTRALFASSTGHRDMPTGRAASRRVPVLVENISQLILTVVEKRENLMPSGKLHLGILEAAVAGLIQAWAYKSSANKTCCERCSS